MGQSIFPTGIDTFPTHYDPPASVMPLVAQYETLRAIQNKTPTQQEEFEQLAIELAPYIFTTEELNTMQDAMVNLETYFRDETIGQLEEWQTDINEWIEARVDRFTFKGEYNEATTYYEENIVRYQNSLFVLKVESLTGTAPTGLDTDPNWGLYVPNQKGDKGDKGDPGLNLVFRGQWQANTDYLVNDLMTYGNQLFACTNQHTSGTTFDSSNWVSVIDSNNIDLESAAMKMNCFYRCVFGETTEGDETITEKIITSMDTSDPLNTTSDGTAVLTCVSTMTTDDAGTDTITSVYTDTLDLLGFGGEFTFITKMSADGQAVTYKYEPPVVEDPFDY